MRLSGLKEKGVTFRPVPDLGVPPEMQRLQTQRCCTHLCQGRLGFLAPLSRKQPAPPSPRSPRGDQKGSAGRTRRTQAALSTAERQAEGGDSRRAETKGRCGRCYNGPLSVQKVWTLKTLRSSSGLKTTAVAFRMTLSLRSSLAWFKAVTGR